MNTIMAQKRDPAAKAKQLRRSGIVPCVIYGADLPESISAQINLNTARQLRRSKRNGSKLNIQLDGKNYPSLIKNLEYSRANDEVVHISFLVMDSGKKHNSVADIVLINKEKSAGILEQLQMQIPHAALPEYLIDIVTIDIEKIPVGTTLTIGDIPEFQSEKIDLQADSGNIVLRIKDKKRVETKIPE